MSSSSLLESLLQLPDTQLQHSIAIPAVHSVLLSLLSTSSTSTPTDRELLHEVIARLALLPKGTLDLPLLVVYSKTFYRENRKRVETVVHDAFSTSLSLKQAFTKLVPAALEQELVQRASDPSHSYDALETLLILQLVAHEHLPPPDSTTTNSILTHLGNLYSDLNQNEQDASFDDLRLLVLSGFASILTLPSYSLEQLDSTLRSATSLGTTRLLEDTETYLNVTKLLGDRVQGAVGNVARAVKDSIGKIKKMGVADRDPLQENAKGKGKAHGNEHENDDGSWAQRVQRKARLGGNAHEIVNETSLCTGEGASQSMDEEGEIVSTISSIQELLPHLSTPFLRIAIQHPSFRPDQHSTPLSEVSERLISALLENDLPIDLAQVLSREANADLGQVEDSTPSREVEKTQPVQPPQRSNIFDEDKSFSNGKLLLPGSKGRDSAAQGGLNLDERLKESIIALAEAPSSDEEEEDGEAFLEDSQEAGGAIKVGVRDNGDEDDEDDVPEAETPGTRSGAQTPALSSSTGASNLFTPATVQLLEQTYFSAPAVFASDSVTRRTNKARIKLREQTGLDDNQLEGWKRMLERGGEKQIGKMRDRIMDLNARGNHPAEQTDHDTNSARTRGSSNGRGRGGGTGANRGGRGGSNSNRGKGDGGRAQHDRRKRGNDRKMAKMGATL